MTLQSFRYAKVVTGDAMHGDQYPQALMSDGATLTVTLRNGDTVVMTPAAGVPVLLTFTSVSGGSVVAFYE